MDRKRFEIEYSEDACKSYANIYVIINLYLVFTVRKSQINALGDHVTCVCFKVDQYYFNYWLIN